MVPTAKQALTLRSGGGRARCPYQAAECYLGDPPGVAAMLVAASSPVRPAMPRPLPALLLVAVILTACAADHTTWDSPPSMQIDTSHTFHASITTRHGDMRLELFAADVPITVNNYVFLARQGFYDGTTFHRILAGFMAQGGDPTGTGSGGPGYTFADEITTHKHEVHTLSMANSGPDTNGSQFFITFKAQGHLDGKHSVFGKLVDGVTVLDALVEGDVMTKVSIEEGD